MQNNFTLQINCVVFGVNPAINKRCVLSSIKEDNIQIPSFILEPTAKDNLDTTIISFVKEHVFVSDLELLPQLITLHTNRLPSDDNVLNVVYGFVVDYNSSINHDKARWVEFDPLKEHELSHVLLEVMHKLT